MKILFSILFNLGIINLCLGAPSNSMSLQYNPSPNDIINSSSYKSEENHQITTYNAHTHTDITSLGTITSGTWQATVIGALYGGTGFTTYTTGDLIYSSATNTLSKLGIGTNGNLLYIASGIPAWLANGTDKYILTSSSGTPTWSATTGITTLGTITTGVWNGTDIALGYGGIGSKKIDSGSVSIPDDSTAAVSFAFTFGSAPNVVISPCSNATGSVWLSATSITTTGFTARQSTGSAESITGCWFAHGSE